MKVIQKNIPIPEQSYYKKMCLTLDEMEIWDSFVIDSREEQKYIVALFTRMRKKWKDFTTRNDWVRRLWRIK